MERAKQPRRGASCTEQLPRGDRHAGRDEADLSVGHDPRRDIARLVSRVMDDDVLDWLYDQVVADARHGKILDQLVAGIVTLARGRGNLHDNEWRLEDRGVEIGGYAALDRGIGLPRVIVVDNHCHPVREHGARQTYTRNGVAEGSRDRQLDNVV